MDAVEFLMERKRMCQFNFKGFVPGQRPCGGCPAARGEDGMCMAILDEKYMEYEYPDVVRAVNLVEEWSKEHPKNTRLTDFLEKYPEAPMNDEEHPKACCRDLGYCTECIPITCRECWNTPLKENKKDGR